ncbi:MAG: hypothetical protein ACTHMT_14595 [Verrucomicrobiota bacterium]
MFTNYLLDAPSRNGILQVDQVAINIGGVERFGCKFQGLTFLGWEECMSHSRINND